jgi:anaerobic magnesium-protoporphyrin IX monomethyl ester cyclase
MKVLLVDPPWYSLQGMSHAPLSLGLGYLGSFLEKAGHKCIIFSGEIGFTKKIKYQEIVIDEDSLLNLNKNPVWIKVRHKLSNLMNRFNPDIIGITMPTAKYGVVVELIKFIKKSDPNIKIVVGGPHPTILPEETLDIKGIDFIVRGEGEETFLELINSLKNKKDFSKIKGISYKKANKKIHNPPRPYIENLDELPFPNWDLVYEREKLNKNDFGRMITSRGCPYQCTFCASKKIWSLKVRYRSPENVFEEIKEKKRKYNIDMFHFNDDSFTIRKDAVMKFCDMLIKSNFKLEWSCDTRVNLLDYELLKKMKQSGCVQLNLGIECGNDKMLKYIKKGITLKQVIKTFEMANKLKIGTLAYFMMGFPDETKKDLYDTIKLMKKIKPSHPCWSIVTAYPGTELYETCKKEGLIKKDIDWSAFHHHSKNMGFSKYINRKEFVKLAENIEKTVFKMKVKYYLTHPKRLLKGLKII